MKRTGNLFDEIVEWKNLRLAAYKAFQGKRTRLDARQFASQLDARLNEMANQLRAGTFPLGRCRQFVIHDPKRRTITAPCFAERVLHHAIMNVCEPLFDRRLIHDTYACRAGRGREAAVRRAQCCAHRFPSYLKLDIRHQSQQARGRFPGLPRHARPRAAEPPQPGAVRPQNGQTRECLPGG